MAKYTRIELNTGKISIKQLKECISSLDDNDEILIMMEHWTGVGGRVNYLEFNPALQGKEKEKAIENCDIWEDTLWVGIG